LIAVFLQLFSSCGKAVYSGYSGYSVYSVYSVYSGYSGYSGADVGLNWSVSVAASGLRGEFAWNIFLVGNWFYWFVDGYHSNITRRKNLENFINEYLLSKAELIATLFW